MIEVLYKKIVDPEKNTYLKPVDFDEKTMEGHQKKVLRKMQQRDLDALIIYGDREHGANFAYLTGFEPRFEEALLVLHRNGNSVFLFGNENLKMHQHSFIKGKAIHVPHFSLPYQPMEADKTFLQLISEAGICDGMRVGCVGWKIFTSKLEENKQLLDIPTFVMDAIRQINPNGEIENATEIFQDAEKGVRIYKNANEIAHYEYGAGLASAKVLEAMNKIALGKTEMEIAGHLMAGGQPTTVTTICATGDRFTNAVVFPRHKKISLGDRFSLTFGLRGGLTSRSAYIAFDKEDLPLAERDYMEKVAIPYYRALIAWLEMMEIGIKGDEIYQAIEEILPKDKFFWELNPGHYTDDDEWSSSPIYPKSKVELRSGMLLQLDIIPKVPGYGGVSAEDGIAIGDSVLRRELQEQYPETWGRIQNRRNYISKVLGIQLKDEILPMSDILGYYRPLLLNKGWAFVKHNPEHS